jgi:hypothetical protein
MNFDAEPGASRDELEAVAEGALNAVCAAHAAGEVADVAVLLEEDRTNTNNNNDNANDANDNANDANDDNDDNNNDVVVCPNCEQFPCVFRLHKESLVAYDKNEQMGIPPDQVPPNIIRRKAMCRQLTRVINGGPMGAGVRKPLPDCCVLAAREMAPSEIFMGFRAEQCRRYLVEEK